MKPNRFIGVAYWSASNQDMHWTAKALDVLRPLESGGVATVSFQPVKVGDVLGVHFGEESHLMQFVAGNGRGTVTPRPSAGAFIVCLLALRKQLSDISVVDDRQQDVSSRILEANPLFGANWPLTQQVAELLGMVTDATFRQRHRAIMARMM